MFIQLHLDVDLLLPIVKAAKERGDLNPVVYLSDKEINSGEGFRHLLKSLDVNSRPIKHELIVSGKKPRLSNLDAVITASETTANPHRAAHVLTKRANQLGLKTYTIQHGFENIGLTYFDQIHTVESIRFASQKIFTWCPIDKLHESIPEETKSKCVPVGCCKDLLTDVGGLAKPGNRKFLIGVFENLHWHRYDENYRGCFLSDLTETAREFSDTTFVVKPHPAGKWLTQRYKGPLPIADNIIVARPGDPEWIAYTAQALIAMADGIITTPSTVAVDAARVGRPVAVVGNDLELRSYQPLPILQSRDDWATFVKGLHTTEGRFELEGAVTRFSDSALVPGDACGRILDYVLKDLS